MMNRRQFVGAAASAAFLARMPRAHAAAAPYDVLIRGGRVIDPSRSINAIRDIAIAQGRIVGRRAQHPGHHRRNDRREGQDRDPRHDRPPHALRPGPPKCADDPIRRRDVLGRCGVQRRGQDRQVSRERQSGAKHGPRIWSMWGARAFLPEGDAMDISRADVRRCAGGDRAQPRHCHRGRRRGSHTTSRAERPRSREARAGDGHGRSIFP